MNKNELLNYLALVDPEDPRPLYSQIIHRLCLGLAAGRLLPGDKLPSTRELARHLGVNLNTSARIYRELTALELVYSKPGVGVFIAHQAPEKGQQRVLQDIAHSLTKAMAEAREIGLDEKEILAMITQAS